MRKRLIQVGVGGMGAHWTNIVAQSDRWQAAAFVDVNRKNLMAAAALHGMPRSHCFQSLARALQAVEADALLDVTPQQFRKEVCLAAFEKGLDVLCEKPLADSLANARALVEAADRAGCVLMVAQNYRYGVEPQTARRFVASGKLGDIGYVDIAFHKGPRFGGFREEMDYPLVLDMSIHHFDLVRCILGTDIRAAQAVSVNAPWNWNKGDATVMAQLELENGAVVNYHGSWVARGWETTWNGAWRFDGGKGALLWDADGLAFSNKPGSRRAVRPVKWPRDGQAYLLDAFADALDTQTQPETSGRDNLNSLAATYAVVRAAREQRRVELAELLS